MTDPVAAAEWGRHAYEVNILLKTGRTHQVGDPENLSLTPWRNPRPCPVLSCLLLPVQIGGWLGLGDGKVEEGHPKVWITLADRLKAGLQAVTERGEGLGEHG